MQDPDYQQISRMISKLQQDVNQLERDVELIGGLSDTAPFRKELTSKVQSISSSVISIKNKLESKSDTDDSARKKWAKLEGHFLANWARLKTCTDIMREKFKSTQPHTSNTNNNQKDNMKTHLLDNKQQQQNVYGGQQQQQNQQQQQDQILFQPYNAVDEMENYEEKLYEIVDNLQQLYEAHKDLNSMIYDQDEIIEVLQENVADARDNISSGAKHLDKAASHQKAYRGKLCIFLIVLLVIAAIITVIVLVSK